MQKMWARFKGFGFLLRMWAIVIDEWNHNWVGRGIYSGPMEQYYRRCLHITETLGFVLGVSTIMLWIIACESEWNF